jgi:hypothetical protein
MRIVLETLLFFCEPPHRTCYFFLPFCIFLVIFLVCQLDREDANLVEGLNMMRRHTILPLCMPVQMYSIQDCEYPLWLSVKEYSIGQVRYSACAVEFHYIFNV